VKQFPTFPQENARIGLLGVAFDKNSSYKSGSALAPQRIRSAFFCASSNLWTENETDLGSEGIFADAGDMSPAKIEMLVEVERAASQLYDSGLKVITFGGDHSVTVPLVQAAAKFHAGLTILHFDAHPDLYDNYENDPFSHASPFARIMEAGLAKRLVQVGIRTINRHQRQQVIRFGVEVLTMQNWQDVFDLHFDAPLYISFDMDCLDPAFSPGISHREPGGLSTREAIRVIQSLPAGVVGADIVEFNPEQDLSGMTDMVAAKIFKEIAAKMLE
jgi:agmatinase